MPSINFNEIPADTRRKLGLRKPRQSQFSKDRVRTFAIRALASMAELTQDQRRRALEHALRLNRI